MKKLILILILMLATLSVYGQDFSGRWKGEVKASDGEIHNILFFTKKTDNGYSSKYFNLTKKKNNIKVESITIKDSEIIYEVPSLKIKYAGKLEGDSKLVGVFSKDGTDIKLDLIKQKKKKRKQKKVFVRPQEPKKPYPYYSEDVTFENEKENIKLAGTLTLPQKEGKFPAVILISGSGPQNRDERLHGHKPFLVLSDHLTRNGIAVLRFDDRGCAKSEGNFKTATVLDFASDVEAAKDYLQTRKEIIKSKIGLIGHSEGGLIAPMVAEKNDDIDFIVLLAGPGITFSETLLLQFKLTLDNSETSSKYKKILLQIFESAYDIVKYSKNEANLRTELEGHFKNAYSEYPELIIGDVTLEEVIKPQVDLILTPWRKFLHRYEPALTLEKIQCPVLAINGSKDTQVFSKINLEKIKTALEKGGNKNFTVKELPGLNHLFQECNTGMVDEYSKIEQTFSPVALEEISKWVLNQLKE